MLYTERAALIMQQLQLQSTVKVGELSQLLQVSVDTVRRDLKAMEQQGLIKYVHGGACLPESLSPLLPFTGRNIVHGDLKRAACIKALSLIQEGDVIALNAGTTNTILAQELAALNRNITVITNNYAAIQMLLQNEAIQLIAIGGQVDPSEQSSFGTVCENEFSQYHPDLAFLSINAVNYQDGFTDFRFHEMGIMQLLARISKRTFAVMDSSKLGKCAKKTALPREAIEAVLMDDHIPSEVREKYLERGISIL